MGGGGGGALMSGRGAADALARMTSIAGGFFLVTSLGLTALSGAAASTDGSSILDLIPRQERAAPAPAAAPSEPARPDPTESSVPELAETQLASMSTPAVEAAPIPAAAIAPPPVVASTRAAPISARQATPTSTRPAQTTPTPRAATTVPASTGQPRVQPPATQRSAVVTQAPATVAWPAPYAGCVGEPSGNTIGKRYVPWSANVRATAVDPRTDGWRTPG